MKFDKILHKEVDEEIVDYGFIFGNNKIVFIKVGAGGCIPGYQGKYLKMAHRIHEGLGATVICSSNPIECPDLDKETIDRCIKKLGIRDAEIYFVGHSDGGSLCIELAKSPLAKKLLCINPSFVPGVDPRDNLSALPEVEKILVFGSCDEEGGAIDALLNEAHIPNLEIKTVEGADHNFTGMVEEFIGLIDLI